MGEGRVKGRVRVRVSEDRATMMMGMAAAVMQPV